MAKAEVYITDKGNFFIASSGITPEQFDEYAKQVDEDAAKELKN